MFLFTAEAKGARAGVAVRDQRVEAGFKLSQVV
jgi:hypothetical protein